MKQTAIDLFCGAGGLSYGLELAGIDVIAGFDNDERALKTFSLNHAAAKVHAADLSKPLEGLSNYKGIDMVVGGPPCQGFSISGKRNPSDIRNELYKVYIQTLKTLLPKVFILENVPNMISMDNGRFKRQIIASLEDIGYNVTYKILTASYFGVPQKRKRVFMIGSRDKHINLIQNEKKLQLVNCHNAISDLPEHGLEDGTAYNITSNSDYQKIMRKKSIGIWNHQITNHEQKTINTIALVPDGGNYKDLPESLQQTRKVNIAWTRYNSSKPSHTIDTGHRHHFHYKFNRVPTVRESARLQSFPDRFHFLGTKTDQYKQVGNAVPPLLAKAIAEQILRES